MRVQRGYLSISFDEEEIEILRKALDILKETEYELYNNDVNEDNYFVIRVEAAEEKLSDVIDEIDKCGEVLVR